MNIIIIKMERDAIDIEKHLKALGEILQAEGAEFNVVIIGGAALILLGLVRRATQDVDIIALADRRHHDQALKLIPPDPLPDVLQHAIARVARDFGLPNDWMNATAGAQWRTGLPDGISDRIDWQTYGGLHVGIVSRRDLITFKFYAAVDSGPRSVHVHDLLTLNPTEAELNQALRWTTSEDTSQEFAELAKQALEYVQNELEEQNKKS